VDYYYARKIYEKLRKGELAPEFGNMEQIEAMAQIEK